MLKRLLEKDERAFQKGIPLREMAANTGKKAILVVSFGTSFTKTREKNIGRIEGDIREAFPDYRFYRDWTSKMIISKLLRRDGIHIPTVEEAIGQMLSDGITQVVVQPTHLINGIENERMQEDVHIYGKAFESVSFGTPLLTTTEDQKQALQSVMEEFPGLSEHEGLVFMGHGTTHYANAAYAALDYMLKDLGYPNVFIGTVEAYPAMDTLLKQVGSFHPKKVFLAPFMVVAGDHAIHDMSGEDEASWRSRFEAAGFQVECVMKGLGEYSGIRRLYVEHAKEAEQLLCNSK